MQRGYTCLWRKIWSNAVLVELVKRFSRLEAWLYITNVLAAPMDDPIAGLKRGEFVASVRELAKCFHWSIGAVHRFLEILLQNSMIMRVVHQLSHMPGTREVGPGRRPGPGCGGVSGAVRQPAPTLFSKQRNEKTAAAPGRDIFAFNPRNSYG